MHGYAGNDDLYVFGRVYVIEEVLEVYGESFVRRKSCFGNLHVFVQAHAFRSDGGFYVAFRNRRGAVVEFVGVNVGFFKRNDDFRLPDFDGVVNVSRRVARLVGNPHLHAFFAVCPCAGYAVVKEIHHERRAVVVVHAVNRAAAVPGSADFGENFVVILIFENVRA